MRTTRVALIERPEPSAGVKRTEMLTRADLRACSSRAALGVNRTRTFALPLAPTLTAPEPSCLRLSFAVAVARPADGALIVTAIPLRRAVDSVTRFGTDKAIFAGFAGP